MFPFRKHVDADSVVPAVVPLDPVAVSIMLHAHVQQPMIWTRRANRAAKQLLRDGLIYKTQSNGGFPFGNSSVAHDLVCHICSLQVNDFERT